MATRAATFAVLWRNAPAFRWLVTIASGASVLAVLFPPRLTTGAALGPGQYQPASAGQRPPPIPTGPGSAAPPAPASVAVPPAGPLAPARPGLQPDAPSAAAVRSAPSGPTPLPEHRGLAPARPGFGEP